jgi:succinate dehydrogenase / fumarate reductase cytochrome b subunit
MPKSSRQPISPHLQIYRPQLTSVLSFAHRVTGLTLGLYSIALVTWLVAAAAGPRPFSAVQGFMRSIFGEILLVGGTFCFFLHLCGGVRHLFWDSGRGFELGAIYASGWAVVAVSTALTVAAWVVGMIFVG